MNAYLFVGKSRVWRGKWVATFYTSTHVYEAYGKTRAGALSSLAVNVNAIATWAVDVRNFAELAEGGL